MVLLALVAVFPMFTSCLGELRDELMNEIDMINQRLDSLENDLNNQIVAFDKLVNKEEITIAACTMRSDSSYVLTLSDGTTFTVLPDSKDMTTLVTFVEENGVKYWAVYGKDGKLKAVTDAAGKKIPMNVLPEVVEEDGDLYLVFGDSKYLTGFDINSKASIFTDCTMNADENGNVYSVTFVLGESGLEFTFAVDGYKGFRFLSPNAVSPTVIKEYYVNYGTTVKILIDTEHVIDYVMQIPDGWRVKEIVDEQMAQTYLAITAPSREAVAAEAAVSAGDLKVVAVLEGNTSAVARLELTTQPFKKVTTTSTNAIVEKVVGVDRFVYGIMEFDLYSDAAAFEKANALLLAADAGVADDDLNMLLTDVYGAELEGEKRYILWAMPAFYDAEGEDAGYYLNEDVIQKYEFGAISVNFNLGKVVLDDAQVSVSMAGVETYYVGTLLEADGWQSQVIADVNAGEYAVQSYKEGFETSAFSLVRSGFSLEHVQNVNYISWIVPVQPGKTEYSVEDIVYLTFKLPELTMGGTLTVAFGEPVMTRTTMTVPLSSPEAKRIYYRFDTTLKPKQLKTEEDRFDYVLEYGEFVNASSCDAFIEKLDPKAKKSLFVMAVDENGKCSQVVVYDGTLQTKELVFNELTVTIEEGVIGDKKASFPITITGGTATDVIYWAGKVTDEFWALTSYCGKDSAKGEKYMALYPDDTYIKRAMTQYSYTDGVLNLTNLGANKDYVVLFMAKDAETGEYSHAGYKMFRTMQADLGTIVRTDSDEWTAAKAAVNVKWHENRFMSKENQQMFAFYAFDFSCPSDMTAYVVCASEDYYFANPDFSSVEDIIIEIETYCSRKYQPSKVILDANGDFVSEPNWVDDSGEEHTGTLMNVYDFYVHGYPTNGFATYFAAGTHGASNCTAWESDCTIMTESLNAINKYLSLDYWKDYVKTHRGNYCKTEAVITKCATDLYNAYYPYYKDAKPLIYENTGSPLYMEHHQASGPDENGVVVDDVLVVLKDKNGNYYEPMIFQVPDYFK